MLYQHHTTPLPPLLPPSLPLHPYEHLTIPPLCCTTTTPHLFLPSYLYHYFFILRNILQPSPLCCTNTSQHLFLPLHYLLNFITNFLSSGAFNKPCSFTLLPPTTSPSNPTLSPLLIPLLHPYNTCHYVVQTPLHCPLHYPLHP